MRDASGASVTSYYTESNSRRTLLWLAAIVLFGLTLRLLPLLHSWHTPQVFMGLDSWMYDNLAKNLLAGNGYSAATEAPYTPNLYRPPGLPAILAAFYAIFGSATVGVILFQCLLGALTIALTFVLARALGIGPRVALAAACVQAIHPLEILYGNVLGAEVYFSPVMIVTALCVIRYFHSTRAAYLVGAGALLGLGIMIHPLLVFAPFLLLLAPLLQATTRTRRQLGLAALAVLIALAPAGAWVIRNAVVADYPGISSVAAVNLLKYKAAGVEAELNGTSREAERDRLTAECERDLPSTATPGDRLRAWQANAMGILKAHPVTYVKLHLQGMLLELIGPDREYLAWIIYGHRAVDANGQISLDTVAQARAERPALVLEGFWWMCLAVQIALSGLLLVGIGSLALQRRWALLGGLLLLPAYVLALSGGPEASPRFRVNYMPMFSILAGIGGMAIWKWVELKRTRSRSTGLASGTIISWPAHRKESSFMKSQGEVLYEKDNARVR